MRVAVERGADAVLVHHGWMWRNEDRRVIGTRRTRMALALNNDLNLYAYHLPLDAHPQLGNNAQLARVLGLAPSLRDDGAPRTCGPDNLVWLGDAPACHAGRPGRARARTPGPRAAAGGRSEPAAGSRGLVHRRRAGHAGRRGGRRRHRLHHGRGLRIHRAPGAQRPAWASSARATMPPNATASRRWDRPWPNASASRSSSWTSTTPSDRPDASAPRRQATRCAGKKNAGKGRFSIRSRLGKAPGNARATQGSCSFFNRSRISRSGATSSGVAAGATGTSSDLARAL